MITSKKVKIYKNANIRGSTLSDYDSIGDYTNIDYSFLDEYVRIDRNNQVVNSKIGRHTYTGRNTIIVHAIIGNFCCISWNVSIGGANHDYHKLSSHSFVYNNFDDLRPNSKDIAYDRFSSKCCLGNDVWIGSGANILRGVTIGDGAIVGANSVVTKSVPPYAIVVGSPAKIIGYRFSKIIINKLLDLKWWNWNDEKIKENYDFFTLDLDEQVIENIKQFNGGKKMKRLMILGASNPQVELIKAAKELDYYTIVASIKGNYPAFEYADEICYVDITNPEAVFESAKNLNIDGIATCCMDTGVEALGFVCDKLNLCGITYDAAKLSADKLLMKKSFEKFGVNTARFRNIENEADLNNCIEDLKFPLIIKAVDLMGSKGIYICKEECELRNYYHKVMQDTKKNYCIVEEFIEGIEFGAQAFVYNNQIEFILPHGDVTFMGKTAIPVGHYVPLDMDESIIKKAEIEIKKAINAIGLNNCAVNCDLIMKNNEVYVIELTGRVGATCLPELVSIYHGINYYKAIASLAIGDNPLSHLKFKENKTANISQMLLSEVSGVVKEIHNYNSNDEDIYDVSFVISEGSIVNKFENAKHRLGQVIVKGKDLDKCRYKLEEVLKNIKIDIE